MSEEKTFRIEVNREKDFVFVADFGLDGVEPLVMDEPEPLGTESGPNASRLLAAAMGNCLSASLLFCLRKSRVDVSGMRATVECITARNEGERWRIREMNVVISPGVAEVDRGKLERCVGIFEGFCIVSQSVEEGIPIRVDVQR